MSARLIDMVEEYLRAKGISASEFGRHFGDPRLVPDMRLGRRPGARLTQRICDFMDAPAAEVEAQLRTRTAKWDAETTAAMMDLLAIGAGREDMAARLGVPPNEVKRLFRLNGLHDVYDKVMRSRRGQKVNGPHVVEPSPDANVRATQALASRLSAAGLIAAKPVERAPLSFEQQLELVRQGKARVVPNIKVSRPPTYVQMPGAMS